MGKVAQNIAARVSQLAAAEEGAPTADVTTSASAPEPATGAPPSGDASGAGSGAAASAAPTHDATGEPIAQPPPEQKTRHELLEEKLRETRERRAAQREMERARAEREAAAKDREAAAKDREAASKDWDALRKGTFKEAILARGEDPRAVFEAMAEEARNAGKPETLIAKARADFDKQMAEIVEPLKKKIGELEEREQRAQAQAYEARLVNDFHGTVQRQEFTPLLVEYEPDTLFGMVKVLHDEPQRIFDMAKRLDVRLTAAPGRFNMLDICNVLRAQHDAHERGKEQRRARLQASTTSPGAPPQAPAKTPTVNGTAEKRNAAGNPLGNDAAASRATEAQKPRLTRQQRIQKLIDDGS